jgi:small subunit ribosomal protein S18
MGVEKLAEEEKKVEEGSKASGDEQPQRRSRPQRGRGRRYSRRPRVCQFCADKTKSLDYKQIDLLKRYVTDQGKIRSRRETGACAKHQRMVARAVKRARHMALLPFAAERYR